MRYFDQIRNEIDVLLPKSIGTVMEIGCGTGNTLKWLKREYGANRTIGVEISNDAAQIARKNCDMVHSINAVTEFDELASYKDRIDVVLLLDILEHLENPWEFLRALKTLLADNAVVIASIPNIRSIKVVGPLVFKGQWRYANSGILDITHLRFFTRESSVDLFNSSGYSVTSIIPNGPVSLDKAKTIFGKVVAMLNMLVFRRADGFLANQYLLSAKSV